MVSILQKRGAVACFYLFYSEETEVNALASALTQWMFTCGVEEDMGQIIEQCAFEEKNKTGSITLYFGKPKVGLRFHILQHTGELLLEQDQTSQTVEKQIYNLQYGNKVYLLAMRLLLKKEEKHHSTQRLQL